MSLQLAKALLIKLTPARISHRQVGTAEQVKFELIAFRKFQCTLRCDPAGAAADDPGAPGSDFRMRCGGCLLGCGERNEPPITLVGDLIMFRSSGDLATQIRSELFRIDVGWCIDRLDDEILFFLYVGKLNEQTLEHAGQHPTLRSLDRTGEAEVTT